MIEVAEILTMIYSFEYNHRDESDNAFNYYVEYQTLVVTLQFLGEEGTKNLII